MALIFSPSSSGNRLTIGLPRLVRLPNTQLRLSNAALRAWVDQAVPHPLPSITVAQAAKEYNLEVELFASWVRKGKISGVPVDLPENGRISRALLDAWEASLPEC